MVIAADIFDLWVAETMVIPPILPIPTSGLISELYDFSTDALMTSSFWLCGLANDRATQMLNVRFITV